MKKFFVALAALAVFLNACGPYGTPSEVADQKRINSQQEIYASIEPVPVYDYSLPRDVMIQIYTAKNKANSTYTVFLSNNGIPLYVCPSRGYPIEGGTQLTNPEQISFGTFPSGGSSSAASGVVGQADPDGLFHPLTAPGTYVLCVRPNGDVVPLYAEPMVMTFPFEVKIVNGQIVNVDTSPSSSVIDLSHATHVVMPVAGTPVATPTVKK